VRPGNMKEMNLTVFFDHNSSKRSNELFKKGKHDRSNVAQYPHCRVPEQFRFRITLQTRYAAKFRGWDSLPGETIPNHVVVVVVGYAFPQSGVGRPLGDPVRLHLQTQ
jgi:hypothetical protein